VDRADVELYTLSHTKNRTSRKFTLGDKTLEHK
jgi:hypothetical protein